MKNEYDELIEEHYRKVAQKHGLSSASTMEDNIMREKETQAIIRFVDEIIQNRGHSQPVTILDIGCGNGYTLEMLQARFPIHQYVGIENNHDLHKLAEKRFETNKQVKVFSGDIRQPGFNRGITADILICQRVLINLLASEDQKTALQNIIASLRPPNGGRAGGAMAFIEGFAAPFERLNTARDELGLSAISPAYHNQYLPDDFFATPQLTPIVNDRLVPANFLSTHYFTTRVLFPFHTQGKPLKRNSEFVNFFSNALPEDIGDYSPVKICYFERSE